MDLRDIKLKNKTFGVRRAFETLLLFFKLCHFYLIQRNSEKSFSSLGPSLCWKKKNPNKHIENVINQAL